MFNFIPVDSFPLLGHTFSCLLRHTNVFRCCEYAEAEWQLDPRIPLCDLCPHRTRWSREPMSYLSHCWKRSNKHFHQIYWLSRTRSFFYTYNVNILFQLGINVLYSVCVCNRELTNSSTQNGSDLPPKSAAAKPVAPNTFTVKWPTSRKFWCVFVHRYLCSSVWRSRGSDLYDVRSVIVSDAVVPLIVSIRNTSVEQSSNCCHKLCVLSRGRLRKSIVHFPYCVERFHSTSSKFWSSSNKWRSNCSSQRACHDVLLLYFSFPNLDNGKTWMVAG